jgi:hypothetical protein
MSNFRRAIGTLIHFIFYPIIVNHSLLNMHYDGLIIGLRIKESKEVFEGEVTALTPVETEAAVAG